ncbi:minor tail protein [Mycobacterium phage Nhonho]|uniref:minor tail protein n=1 Tax=Mycobacterium phage Nhonho TaxID=1675553 RepID=UPI0006A2D12C|nr:minor tail protein [Mycobacterium phage Nhonho]AKU45423.1 minor tail protein [Mycobacterium phage Nhonho]
MPAPAADMTTLAGHQQLWDTVMKRRQKREDERIAPPLIRLWDGDYKLRGQLVGERSHKFEFIENETGTASITISLDHYLAKWIASHKGRARRNVHVSFDKQGARWTGRMDHYDIVRTKEGDVYMEVVFKHDYEELKHIYVWANPFLRPEFQFPKLWVMFGPAKWALLLTLFVNILRLESSLWTLPDNPLDISEWFPFSLNPGNWRNIVKPFPFLADNSPLTIVFSRFKSFHDTAKNVLADSQLTIVCRRYFHGEDPHPFAELSGELGLPLIEGIASLIPLRHGCLVWDIVDNSGWGSETAFGGSLLTGLVRAVMNIASDGMTEGIDIYTGLPTYPGEYYTPGFLGTYPKAPHVVFMESPYTGIESSKFTYTEATDTSFVLGGQSMPGVNEIISAGINMGGDFLTSLINSQLATLGAFGGAIDLPPLGGIMDAVARPLYENVVLAFMEIPTLRAAGLSLPIAGLEDIVTGLGDFHYNEGWVDGADKAFTISAIMAARAKQWATRAKHSHEIQVSDAAPYVIGERGHGHFWLGDRVGTTVLGYPDPYTIFVERVTKLTYEWTSDGPKGWTITIGYKEPEDPILKAFELIQYINSNLGQLGIL